MFAVMLYTSLAGSPASPARTSGAMYAALAASSVSIGGRYGRHQLVPQIGNDALAAGVDHQGRGDDAAHDDAPRMRVLEGGQKISNQRHALWNRARPAPQCVGEALAFDPVGRAIP